MNVFFDNYFIICRLFIHSRLKNTPNVYRSHVYSLTSLTTWANHNNYLNLRALCGLCGDALKYY